MLNASDCAGGVDAVMLGKVPHQGTNDNEDDNHVSHGRRAVKTPPKEDGAQNG